jgi:hypothetical protein
MYRNYGFPVACFTGPSMLVVVRCPNPPVSRVAGFWGVRACDDSQGIAGICGYRGTASRFEVVVIVEVEGGDVETWRLWEASKPPHRATILRPHSAFHTLRFAHMIVRSLMYLFPGARDDRSVAWCRLVRGGKHSVFTRRYTPIDT